MLVYLWYTLITPVSVGMPVITIIIIFTLSKHAHICQIPRLLDLHPIPDSFVGQSVKHSYHQPSWQSDEKEAAALTPACSFTHTFCCLLHISTLLLYLGHVYILPMLVCLQNFYLHNPITCTSPVQKDHFHDIGMPVTHSYYVLPMLVCLWKLNLL